ncbi:MAG: glycosyltransferase family 39 protein, partial [Deltaproteobacteria bacterium]|nr:glycosyltransferase family 39 protein [Deltaproteobacteria bacterium]
YMGALPAWWPQVGVAIALAALVVWSFVQRWNVLSASPFPLGVDGYFYPVQLRSLLETGELQYPASPLAFWLMAPFAAATDPITGAKLGAAVLGALIALPAYAVGAQLGRDGDERGRGAGLIAAVLATTSAGSMYMTIEFVKNGIGLTVAMTALWLVLRALEVPTRRRTIVAILGIVAAVLTHKMAAGIVIGIAIPAALVETHQRGKLRWRRALPIGIALGVLGVLVLIGVAMPRRFLSPADLALLDNMFTTEADWSLPALGGKLTFGYEPAIGAVLAIAASWALLDDKRSTRGRLLVVGRVLQCVGVMMALGAIAIGGGAIAGGIVGGGLVLVAGGLLLRRWAGRMLGASLRAHAGAGRDVAAWCALALAAVISLPWLDATHSQGLAMRLRVIAFVPMALCAAIVFRVIGRYAARMFDGDRRPPPAAFGVVIAIAIVAIRAGGGPQTEGQVVTHPALIASVQAAVGKIPDGGVAVVQERHIAFMFAWYAQVPISMRPEPFAPERRYRVMPLAFIQIGSALDASLLSARDQAELRVIGLHPLHPNGMVIVPEATWQVILARLSPFDRMRLDAWPTI